MYLGLQVFRTTTVTAEPVPKMSILQQLCSFTCLLVCLCTHMCGCPWRASVGAGSIETGVTGGCEPLHTGAKEEP